MREQVKELEALCKQFIKAYDKQEKCAVGCFSEDSDWYDKKYRKAMKKAYQAEKNLLEAIVRITK